MCTLLNKLDVNTLRRFYKTNYHVTAYFGGCRGGVNVVFVRLRYEFVWFESDCNYVDEKMSTLVFLNFFSQDSCILCKMFGLTKRGFVCIIKKAKGVVPLTMI